MNEKLPIEFKEREKERTSSTRNRFPRMDHGGVPSVSREPVHRYQRKHQFPPLYFHEHVPGEGDGSLDGSVMCVPYFHSLE